MTDYSLIKTGAELQKYVDELLKAKHLAIALDTEANNHRYAYGQQLCLIQVYDGTRGLIIDPFNIKAGTLRNLFESRDILKIMYDAPNDISLLVNAKNITIKSILDLRPGVELLEYPKKDLHSVINAELGIELKDKKKYQEYNWLRRPLPDEAIDYALNDVKYLFDLKEAIIGKLYQKNFLDIFMLRNIRIQNRDYYHNPKDNYKRMKGYRGLDDTAKPRFQQLYNIREKYAKLVNMPSANIISNGSLLDLANGTKSASELNFPKRLKEDIRNSILHELSKIVAPADKDLLLT